MSPGAAARTTRVDIDHLADQLKVLGNAKRLHLVRYLVEPHYLEEIASELKMARQTAQEHVQRLVDIGLVTKRDGRRDHGPVTEYVVVPQRLFAIHEEMGRLGDIAPDLDENEDMRARTQMWDGGTEQPGHGHERRLTIVHGLRIGHTVPLAGGGPWLIGRDPHAAVNLDYDPFVSNRHAEVRENGARLELADLYASNGTWVDFQRVPRGGTVAVGHGSLIRTGRTLVLVRTDR